MNVNLLAKFHDLPVRPIREMGLKELERIRLILCGGSVVDWRRLHFQTWDEVDRFLRLCQVDCSYPPDESWVRAVLEDAVEYLRRTFNYKVTEAVAKPEEIHDLFLYASGIKEPKYRKISCLVLKVMHVIQHMEGRDLLFRLAVSEAMLTELVVRKVKAVVQDAKAKGLPIIEFSNSIKSRESLVTKLLAKKETVAAQIYDKTRFRIVAKGREDILTVLYFLTQRLVPFNFVVPGQTENSFITFRSLLRDYPNFASHAKELHWDVDYEDEKAAEHEGNSFSGGGYRALNFVVDLPIRMDDYLPPPEKDDRPRKSRVAFMLVEFQLVDEETAKANEEGENAHERYKRRQKRRVLRRLSRGLVVPKKV